MNAFAQGAKRLSENDPIEEKDKDRPDLRDRWLTRGQTAPAGQSPAALRLRAHQQKLALRVAAAKKLAAVRLSQQAADAPQPDGSSGTPWVPLGPSPLISDQNFYGTVSGRVTSVVIDPSDVTGNTVYVAGASGGVWKSTNATTVPATSVSWTPLTDQQASLVNGAISVKSDGSIVLVGTGEPNSAIDSYYGAGILRSTNHGATWTLIPTADGGTNSFAGLGFSRFAWDTVLPSTVVAATGTTAKGFEEGKFTGSTNRGLFYSSDSGQTWSLQVPQDSGVTVNPAAVSATDVVYNTVAGKFFAAVRYHGVYSSSNGQNWTRLTNQPNPTVLSTANCPSQIPGSGSNCPIYRGQLAVVPGRQEMYFWFVNLASQSGNLVVVDEGIWRSPDGGNSWTRIDETGISNCGDPGNIGCGVDQGYYNLELAAVPNGQATDLYAGAVNLFKCKLTNGGSTCATLDINLPNQWVNLTHVYGCSSIASVHPDQHGLDFMLFSGKMILYFGNDGGVYRTLDGFTKLTSGSCGLANGFDNLNASSVPDGTIGSLTQFVSFSVHPTDVNTLLGGTQDNGSPGTDSATTSSGWTTVNGGDGGYNAIDSATPSQWYTANEFVNIYRCTSGINCTSGSFSLTVASGEVGGDSGPFYTPYILDPQNSSSLLVGTCRVWRGTPTVPPSSLSPLSPDFDTLAATTCTGAETNLVAGLAAGGPLANGLSNVIYATTEGTGPNATPPAGGEVWVTTNAATTSLTQATGTINPSHATISSVAIDGNDATGKTAYVGIMGFLGTGTHVWKTTNAGASWSAFGSTASGLPDAPVNALLVDAAANTIYVGTDVGVYVSSAATSNWSEVGTPSQPGGAAGYLPNVPVTAIRMFISGGTKKLRVSTYGRGIWEYALTVSPDYTNVIANTPQTVYPTQNATFNGTLTAQGGYASTVNLSCSGTTPSTCTLNPTHEVPAAGGSVYTVTAGGAVGDYNFPAHAVGTDGQAISHDAPVTLHVVDFNLTAPDPNGLTVAQGGTSNSSTFQVTAAGSFSGTVALSCASGLPTGATCVFSPSNAVNPTAANPVTVTLTVTAVSGTPVGGPNAITLSAMASGAPAAKTQTFSLTVTAPLPDFSLAVSATPTSTVSGQNITWNGTLKSINGYNASVSLSCAGTAPPTCSVSPASLVPTSGGAPFTVTVGSGSAGAFNFSIKATDATLTHTQAVSLAVGTDVAWTDTGSNSVTVEAGQSAAYHFSAAPLGGGTFTSTVNFSCAGLPALTSCTFSPTSIAAGAGTTAVTLTVATTGPNSGGNSPASGHKLSRLENVGSLGTASMWLPMFPMAGLFLVGLTRKWPGRRRAALSCGVLLTLALLLISCGSVGGGGGQPPAVTVTVSPGSATLYANEAGNNWAPSATQKQFSATVHNAGDQTVTWSVTGGNANGTIDANGLYSAPAVVPNPATVTVTATSALATAPGSAAVKIQPATAVGTSAITVTATAAGGSGHATVVDLTVE